MTHNIHQHITKALHKKKSKISHQNQNEENKSNLNETSELNLRLDKFILEQGGAPLDDIIDENVEQKNKALKIQQLCRHLNQLIKSFIHLQKSLNSSALNDNKQNDYIEDILHIPFLQQTLEQESKVITFKESEQFIVNLLLYLKDFVTIASRNYNLHLLNIVQNPTLANPLNISVMNKLIQDLNEILVYFDFHLDNAHYIQLMLNHLSFQIKAGQKNIILKKVDFSTFIQTVSTDKLNSDMLESLKKNLLTYQNLVSTLGYNRILLLTKEDVSLLIQTHKLYHKVNLLKDSLSIVDDFKNVNGNFLKLSKKLKSISTIITDISKDYGRHHVLLNRIVKGDFFTQKNSDDLYSSIFSLFGSFDHISLINRMIDNISSYTPEQQVESLKFLKNYILVDTNNTLMSIKHEKNQFIEASELFCQCVIKINQNDEIESLVEEILKAITNKCFIKEKCFAEHLSSISKGTFPQTHLIRRLNTINEELQSINNELKMDEYLIEVNFILEAPNILIENNEKITNEIILALEKFRTIFSNTQFANIAEDLNKKFVEKLNTPLKAFTQPNVIPLEEIKPFDMVKLFHEITQGNIMVLENEKLLHDFFRTIKSGFAKRLTMIDTSELRELAWKHNNERMKNNLLPNGENCRKYYQYFNAIIQFFTLSLLCKIEENDITLKPRNNLHEVKKIYEFIEKAILRAIEDGAIATSIAFSTILGSPTIKRLGFNNSEMENLRKSQLENTIASTQSLSNAIFIKDILPYLGTLQSQIEKAYLQNIDGEFEKSVLIGRMLRAIEEKKASVKEGLVKNDLTNQIFLFMKRHDLVKMPILKDDLLIDNTKILQIASQFSNNLKPDSYKNYDVSQIKSLKTLHELLLFWYHRMEDFHLIGKNPEKEISDLFEKLVTQDTSLDNLKISTDILNLIFQINKSKNRTYKDFEHNLLFILKLYYNEITQILENTIAPNDTLDRFFSTFNHEHSINAFQENVEKSTISTIPFSQSAHLKKMIENIHTAQNNYNKVIEIYKKSHDQQIYSELLNKVLEGENQEPLLQFKEKQQKKSKANVSLLPESEFPVPQAEPEHPNYIGINRTMNFNPAPFRSTLGLFETKELIKDFLHAFPWGAQRSTLNKVEKSKYISGRNLISIPGSISPEIQLMTINYILLSLDCLGSLTGEEGEFAIQNFDKIKMIADELKNLSQLLSSTNDEIILSTKMDVLTFKLVTLNQELQKMQNQADPLYPVQFNATMNEFCHINQYLTHKLLGLPLQKTLLSPLDPTSKLLERVSEPIKNDLIRYHCSSPHTNQ